VPPDLTAPLSAFFSRQTTPILDHFDLMVRDARIEDTLECLRDLARESAETQKFNVLLLLTSLELAIQLRDAIAGSRIIASPSRWTETRAEHALQHPAAPYSGQMDIGGPSIAS
jgi:hypothetical protein